MRRDQTRRAIILLSAFLALAVGVRHLTKRGVVKSSQASPGIAEHLEPHAGPPSTPDAAVGSENLGPPPLARGDRTALVRLARRLLDGASPEAASEGAIGDATAAPVTAAPVTAAPATAAPTIAVISLPRARRSALVARGQGPSPEAAVTAAVAKLAERATAADKANGRLKLDLVATLGSARPFDRQPLTFERSLQGLWLPDLDLMLLPEELEARRLVDSDGDFRRPRLEAYLAEGGRSGSFEVSRQGIRTYHVVTFDSLAEGPRLGGSATPPIRLFRGNDRSPDISPAGLLAAARLGGDYLRSHQKDDGSFIYAYDPKRQEEDDDDNLLRRAGTCYSLVQLHRAVSDATPSSPTTGTPTYLEVARRGLAALLDQHTRPIDLPRMGDGVEALVSPDNELKLGGSALLLLALMEYQEVSGDRRWLTRGQSLARFLVAQQEADGHFISKISTSGKRFDFESGYYPGEAILALTRLYAADGDDRWLEVAVRGADWLINVRDAGKETSQLAHDHWLLMGLEALYRLRGDAAHAAHAGRIAQAIVEAQRRDAKDLDWVGSFYDPPRSTPTATRAEALVAMVALAHHTDLDPRPYIEALLRMASFQRRCQLNDVSAMYLERPDLAIGGFRRGLTHYEIRIDYVQHNISSLLGLRQILLQPN